VKSITIHGLDEHLDRTIRSLADREGLSMNKTIKKVLRSALGLDEQSMTTRREQFTDLFGTWTKQDLEEFQENTADFSQVDPSDWK
jgi:plasmid stability protein